jgi:hypothetical protein
MVTQPASSTNQTSLAGRATQHISLTADEKRIAQELADRHHGGNVSHLFRKLLRLAWAMEEERVA